jgi:hypothetical protein
MNCYFSPTDDQTNLNIPFNIVINNKLNYVAGHYHVLPCGKKYFQSCEISIVSDREEVEIEGIDKIKERKYSKHSVKYEDDPDDWYTKYNNDIPNRFESSNSNRRHAFDFEYNKDIITDAIENSFDEMDPIKDLPGQRYLQFDNGKKERSLS